MRAFSFCSLNFAGSEYKFLGTRQCDKILIRIEHFGAGRLLESNAENAGHSQVRLQVAVALPLLKLIKCFKC